MIDRQKIAIPGITPLVEILEKIGGWPVVKGDNWQSDGWDWLEMSKKISRDGLASMILVSYISVDSKNNSRRIFSVSDFHGDKLHCQFKCQLTVFKMHYNFRSVRRVLVCRGNFFSKEWIMPL